MPTYLGLALVCAGSGLAWPVPDDVPVLLAGARVGTGGLALVPTLVAVILGVCVRDVLCWLLGRHLGGWLLQRRWLLRLVGVDRLARGRALLVAHGPAALVVSRGLVGLRSAVYVSAGAAGMPLLRFLVWDLLALCLSLPLLVGAGSLAGPSAATLVQEAVARGVALPLLVVALGAVAVVWGVRSWRRGGTV